MVNNSTSSNTYPFHGSTHNPVYPGPVREALNSSCDSLSPYARRQREYQVAHIGVGSSAVVEPATSPTHFVSAQHSLLSPTNAQFGFPPTISPPPEVACNFPPSGVRSTLCASPNDGLPRSSSDSWFHDSCPPNALSIPTMPPCLHGSRSSMPQSLVYSTTSAYHTQQAVCVSTSHTSVGLLPVSPTVPAFPIPGRVPHSVQASPSRKSSDLSGAPIPSSSYVDLDSVVEHTDRISSPIIGLPMSNLSATAESKHNSSDGPRASKSCSASPIGKSTGRKSKCKGKTARSVCSICNKTFARPEGLKRHVNRIHGEDQTKPKSPEPGANLSTS
ncbi:hypothetical protein BKA82DRAFT_1006545 [Pisolithus tinctorius]|nr:hypothetical protein BKA82DRAFT_1006545 [Pisolithus tinctorius]